MADLTVTRQDVQLKSNNTDTEVFQAGETIEQGETFYVDNNKAYLTDASAASTAEGDGVALTPAMAIDDYFIGATDGEYDPGSVVVAGVEYYFSTNGGKIAVIADLTTGNYVKRLGTATASDTINIDIQTASAVLVP